MGIYRFINDIACKKNTYANTGNKYFSTKETAEEYILMNKPCLSITDILNIKVFGSHLNSSWIIAQLKKLVKSKL